MEVYDKSLFDQLARKYPVRIDYVEQTESTNLLAADKKYSAGDIIIAFGQTGGRGQRGNTWSSEPGKNLTFSIILAPGIEPHRQFHISRVIALSLTDTLESLGVEASIKWPNDIYVNDRKIAGILIENDIMGPVVKRSIAGVGLNVNQRKFDDSLPNPTSVFNETGAKNELSAVLDLFLANLFKWVEKLSSGEYQTISDTYMSKLYRKEGKHEFRDASGKIFVAAISDVKESGELVLLHADGIRREYLFKEVEFIL